MSVNAESVEEDSSSTMECHVCGEPFYLADDGVSHHWGSDGVSYVDHDADADHVPYQL